MLWELDRGCNFLLLYLPGIFAWSLSFADLEVWELWFQGWSSISNSESSPNFQPSSKWNNDSVKEGEPFSVYLIWLQKGDEEMTLHIFYEDLKHWVLKQHHEDNYLIISNVVTTTELHYAWTWQVQLIEMYWFIRTFFFTS